MILIASKNTDDLAATNIVTYQNCRAKTLKFRIPATQYEVDNESFRQIFNITVKYYYFMAVMFEWKPDIHRFYRRIIPRFKFLRHQKLGL